MNRSIPAVLCAFLLALTAPTAMALDDGWPRTLPVGDGLVTIYPLQVEDLDGDTLRYRAALAWRPTAEADPVFGAGWFESQVVIDTADRIVRPRGLRVVNTRFPEGTAELQSRLETAVAEQSPDWNLDFSLDDLNAGLQTAAAERASLEELNTTPPRIVYRDHPALLLSLDGNPVLRKIEGSPYQAVINTRYPLIFDGRVYYLNAASDVWYRADSATGPYRYEPAPPPDIVAMVRPEDSSEVVETAAEPINAANAPEVVVATEPTELIVTDGPAVFVPLVDDLLVLKNSDDDVFMHVASQQFYIVLAGRWYRSDALSGPWSYRAAAELPAAFANIPPDSAQADSRVYVAGTPEAREAVQDAQIPETRAVPRGPADVEVEYDGEPEFAPVDGTDLDYAANSDSTVLCSNRRYYLVEDGVWYESATPNGPWEVATQRPDGVEAIAPSSPVYNTKYVYIYGATPSVVYVGYTPGYLGNYVYYDTVVYGTGWYYRPWVSPWYYYPRPATWGFHVAYNSWYGWSFGLSWNWGWNWGPFYGGFYSGGYWHHSHHWHHPYRGYWRPRGHRPRPVPYAGRGHSHDRYGRSDYRENRGGYAGGHRLHEDGRGRDRVARTGEARVRNAGFAGSSKATRQRTEPVRASDLRLKARARDVDAAAARSLLMADRGGDVHPRRGASTERAGSTPVGGGNANVASHRTTPTRSNRPQISRGAARRDVEASRVQRGSGSGSAAAPGPRRPVANSPSRASQAIPRQAAQNPQVQRRTEADGPAVRGPVARRDQARSSGAQSAPARQAPSSARRQAPVNSPGQRAAPPRSGAATPPRRQSPAPDARHSGRANGAAAPAQRGSNPGAGKQGGTARSGPKRNRKH